MKTIKIFSIFFIVLFSTAVFSQVSYNTFVASIMNQVNTDSVYMFERHLSGDTACMIGGSSYTIATRNYLQTGNIKASNYIYEKFLSWGLSTRYQNISSTDINVIAKKTGTKYPNQYVIICAHYDDMPTGTTAPGADDNASGTVCVLEAARLLKNINLPYTIIFAAWDEEERGLYGSQGYADSAYARGDSILAVLNFDMIAYDGNNDGALDVNTNTSSMPLANLFAQIVSLYQPTLVPQVTTSLSGGSDHQSFQNRGYQAILSIEDNSDFTPYYHTPNDTWASLNKPYFVKMIKAGVAALVTIAGDYKITITHNPIASGPSTASRTATAVIKSSYRIGIGSNAPRLYYKINGGAYNFLTPSYSNLDTFKFTIPGQVTGTTVSYYIAAQDSAGTLVSTLPSGGNGVNPPGTTPPSTLYSYEVANINYACIGTGTVQMGSASGPFNTYWYGNRTDILYKASEILAAGGTVGNITKLGFQIASVGGQSMNGFNIRMQNTSMTTLTSFVSSDWTTVYSGTYTVPGTGWQYIDLTTPFYWDGVSNILIEICFGNTSYTTATVVYGTTNTNLEITEYHDLSTACSYTGFSTGTVQTARANICFVSSIISNVNPANNNLPKTYSLSQNYPNPFNPVTKINYAIPKAGLVTLRVFDILGREVATLVNGNMEAGYYTYDFDASTLSSGVYIYKITAGTFEKTMRMMVVK